MDDNVEKIGDPLWEIDSLIRRTEVPEHITRMPKEWLPTLLNNSIAARTAAELADDEALLDSIIQGTSDESS